ncbi:MAG: hypothetical protein ACPGXZ_00500 [Saprospiraceae bacterium]
MKIVAHLFVAFFVISLLAACGGGNDDYIPKPRTYPRVIYPEKAYKTFDESPCGFTFQQPAYTEVIKDLKFFGETPKNPCWFDLYYPQFDAKLHCNYVQIDNKDNPLIKLVDDSYKLASKHASRASSIGEEAVYFPNKNVYGVIFPLEGSVASPYQFFVTDSVNHFLRGSLYFNTSPNPDSMAPVIDFIRADIDSIITSFEWE